MGGDRVSPAAAASSPCTSPARTSGWSGKRGRDPEDEVYVDNLHSHKRYLSEIMASSLNGLSFDDALAAETLMESPARSESSVCYHRDEITSQYSPMSEDFDECRDCDALASNASGQTEATSRPGSPASPHRYPKAFIGSSSANPCPLPACSLSSVLCPHQRRGSDTEGRYPSSPNDMCHVADLRRAALLKSVQMRAQQPWPSINEPPLSSDPINIGVEEEMEDQQLSRPKSAVEVTDQNLDHEVDYP